MHKEIKSLFTNVMSQKIVRLVVVLEIFVASKMYAWLSAAQMCLSLPCDTQASVLTRLIASFPTGFDDGELARRPAVVGTIKGKPARRITLPSVPTSLASKYSHLKKSLSGAGRRTRRSRKVQKRVVKRPSARTRRTVFDRKVKRIRFHR